MPSWIWAEWKHGGVRETPCLQRETPFKADAMFGEGEGDAIERRRHVGEGEGDAMFGEGDAI